MTDINGQVRPGSPEERHEPTRHGAAKAVPDPALLPIVELLFFAYRDFISDPDAILSEYGFGRAHHRVLHFVTRSPGLRVADLLDILKITKQSLARVLKQLIDDGFIEQKAGEEDRRERHLYATAKGRNLASRLAGPQTERIAEALREAGPGLEAGLRAFLFGMITAAERGRVEQLLDPPARPENTGGAPS